MKIYYAPGSGASFFFAGLGLYDSPNELAFVVAYLELKYVPVPFKFTFCSP